jgi:hypothetical protein
MTADRLGEPHDHSFNDNEYAIRCSLSYDRYAPIQNREISEISTQLASVSNALDDEHFITSLTLSAILTTEKLSSIDVTRRGTPSPLELAKRWFTGLHSAKRTLERTKQKGVRDLTMSQGTRR